VSLVLNDTSGTVTVPESVLLQIVARAAESVDGARVRRRRSIDVEARVVRLELTARRDQPLRPLAERVQAAVADALAAMCALDVRVDVDVEELE
jgi:uncharacterized alkaline shock family protein YloU